eukprot:CAMPEP_0172323184 /NCGR_PEP_ID=MMETSP1058-20130122/48082_1 /TAXON_ID=83371 /ORGANISM="Detonula confervacea, Strain CCMP 353" /LENGTH=423 /DNA_ID=CAMNT_0013039125 /DNA_START=9 /DNA_END=1280 /DNA_ORIENTATION=-
MHPRLNKIAYHIAYLLCPIPLYAFSPPIRPSVYRQIGLPLTLRYATHDAAQSIKQKRGDIKWIACSSTLEVNRAIEKYVQEGDVVAELGSQLRDSSVTLCETIGPNGKAMLVDIERKFPKEKEGQKRTNNMRTYGNEKDFYTDRATFVETKGFEFWREALFFRETPKPKYNGLVVDMSSVVGNDLDLTCISLVKEFIALNHGSGENDNHCRVVIVKSGSLHNLARRLYHAQRIISGAQSPEHQHNGGHSSIIGAVGVKQYRETIPFVVRKGDICVEVGCHLGTTTTLIDKAANGGDENNSEASGGCLGVDIGSHIIKSARKKYTHLSFEVGDGFKTGELARMKEKHFRNKSCSSNKDSTYDVVYVDIGGLSGSDGLLEAISLLASISNSLEPRCIVIKSMCIRRLSSCLVPFSKVWQEEKGFS